MNCEEARRKFVDYLGNELSQSEKKLMQAHLGNCEACEKELAETAALQGRVSQFLQTRAAQATPSTQALSQLQARLSAEATPKMRISRTSWLKPLININMKGFEMLIKQPVFIALLVLAVLATTAFSVPAVRAQVQSVFDGWSGFSIPNSPDYLAIKTVWDFTPLNPTRMPQGLKLTASMVGGDNTTNELGLCYQPENAQLGDPFVMIQQTHILGDQELPAGSTENIRGHAGSLETEVSGQTSWCLQDMIASQEEIPQSKNEIKGYSGAQRLTWFENDIKIEITGTYSERELLKIANSLRPADIGIGEAPPTPLINP